MRSLVDVVLGTDERMRPRTALTLLTDAVFVAWLLAGGAMWHWRMLDGTSYALILAVVGLPRLAFYPLIRCGWALKRLDAGLTQPQMVHAGLSIALAYVLVPTLRAALLQAMCLVQVFGLFSLRPRAALAMGAVSAGLLLATAALGYVVELPSFDPDVELLRLLMSAFIVTLLSMLSSAYARVRMRVRQQKDELAATVALVHEQAVRDALTGLHNRQHMQNMIERERARLGRGGKGYCVALIDLDHFKQVNDVYGHRIGDEALIGFTDAAQQALRTTDLMARWGGEEFLVLMPDTDPATQGVIAMERLREALAGQALCPSVPSLRLSFSAGVAGSFNATESMESVIGRADAALYAAKARGRNCCVLAGGPDDASRTAVPQPEPSLP